MRKFDCTRNPTAHGPYLVPRRRVSLEDGHEPLPGGMVDLSAARGRRVRVAQKELTTMWGCGEREVRRAVKLGILKQARTGPAKACRHVAPFERCAICVDTRRRRQRMVWIDPADTRLDVYRRWADEMEPPRTIRDFERYRAARRIFAIPHTEPDPHAVYRAMALRILELNPDFETYGPRNMRKAEYATFLPAGFSERLEHVQAALAAENVRLALSEEKLPSGTAPSREMVAAAFPQLGSAIPRTALADGTGRPRQAADLKALAHAWSMEPLRGACLLFCHVAAPKLRRADVLRRRTVNLARFDRHIEPSGPQGRPTSRDVTAALDWMLRSAEAGAVYREHVRIKICLDYLLVRDALESYALAVDPEGSRGLLALVPPDHDDAEAFRALLAREDTRLRNGFGERRKEGSDLLADRIHEVEDAMDLRMEQMSSTLHQLRAHAKQLARTERPSELPRTRGHRPTVAQRFRGLYRDAFVEMPHVSPEGRVLPGELTCHWRVWREIDFRRSLLGPVDHHGDMGGHAMRAMRNRAREITEHPCGRDLSDLPENSSSQCTDAEVGEPVVYEFVRCVSTHGGAVEPWFVWLHRAGVTVSPERMTWRMRARRHHTLRERGVPAGIRGSHGGLLTFDTEGTTLWRIAASRNRLIVPVVEFGHAMLMAQLGAKSCLDSWCRLHEAMQQRYEQDGWRKVPVDGRREPAFPAVPKVPANCPVPKPVDLIVGGGTMLLSHEVARLTIARCGHPDGALPSIGILPDLRWKIRDAAPWVFQFAGRMVDTGNMQLFLDFLLAGVGRWDFHDLRHAAASRGRRERLPLRLRMAIMNHRTADTTRWYDRETRREQRHRANRRSISVAIRAAMAEGGRPSRSGRRREAV